MLLTKNIKIKWNPSNRKWFESKGYIFTKWKDEFEIKVEDLTKGSQQHVNVQCDECGEILIGIQWSNYKKCVKGNGKYYCKRCSSRLFARNKIIKLNLKKSTSFYEWCYENLSKEEADEIMLRWDYDKNKLSPKDVSYGSTGFDNIGYWFKCLNYLEHSSEQKRIRDFTKKGQWGSIKCNQCNSISVTHSELIKYFVNKEDIYKYSYGSKEKVLMKCPDCGYKEGKIIYDLVIRGFNCPRCSDSISYPEKFMFNVLDQLNENFEVQLTKKTFEWCKNFRYDFYIPSINGIVETHGGQHYEESFSKMSKKAKSLSEIQDNDDIKEQLARENGIANYIIINCEKSELKWIKKSIMKSDLPNLLNFKEEDIDWLKCHEYACSSKVKEVCDLWNNTKNLNEIIKITKSSYSVVYKYLKKGSELGWCDYNGRIKAKENINKNHKNNCKKVICLTTGEIFNSQREAEKKYNVTNITYCCSHKRKSAGKHPETGEKLIWMFYAEYILNKSRGD